MDREQAQDLFSAYREGELPREQVESFESYLDRDDEVRGEYEKFCRALDSLSLLQNETAPDDFMENLQKRMRRRSGGKLFGANKWGHVTRVPYELFSLILILIILTVYLLTVPVLRVSGASSNASGGGGQSSEQQE